MELWQQRIVDDIKGLKHDIASLDGKVDAILLQLAQLPIKYVTREEFEKMREQASQRRRWIIGTTIGTFIALLGAFASIVKLFL